MPTSGPSEREERWLLHIIDNANAIERYMGTMTRQEFESNELVRDAVERCLQRATEAVHRLGSRAEELIPNENWRDIKQFGNVLRHEYDRLIEERVFEVATIHLPRLKKRITGIVSSELLAFDPRASDPNAPKEPTP